MRCSFVGLVLSFYIGGVTCLVSRSMSAVEGESPTIDCGFQTSVDGGNLMWRAISTDSETLLGHIVPGDHFCGTDTLACTVHTSGSITLVNITMDDGDKRYRCLRGDEEGYHYFSEVNLIVLSKGVTPPIDHSVQSVVEGESPTIDCGFQTSVDGGNLMWRAISTDSETLLGHIVPGDHFCGTDTVACTVHINGSITLVDVTVDDGDKRYRCLRGDTEGYHYFSDFNLTVLAKGTIGHTLINEVTESVPESRTIGEKSVIYCYDQPTCKDDEDGALIVTCYLPCGEMVDRVTLYDQVHCNYTDTDGNPNSLSITVNSHAELKENCVVDIILACVIVIFFGCVMSCIYQRYKPRNDISPEHFGCCLTSSVKGITGRSNRSSSQHDVEGQELNLDMNTHSQTPDDTEAESGDNSDEIAKLMNEKMNADMSYERKRLTEKETECTDTSEELNKVKVIIQQKDREISDLKQRLTSKKTECTDTSEELNEVKEDMDISDLKQRMTEKETECTGTSEELNKVEEINQPKGTEISDLRQRLTTKETECTDTSEELNEVKEINQQKDMDISDLRQRMTEKETKCTDTSEELNKIEEINQPKDMDISDPRQRMTEKETECTDTSENLNEGEEVNQQEPAFTMEHEEEYFQHTGCKNTDSLQFRRYFHEDLLIGIQCEFCLSEWVVKEYLPPNNLGDELMFTGGRQLHVLKKPYVYESTFRVELKETEIRDILNLADYLSPGDHIKYTSCLGFFNHAIVREVTQDNISLIHWHHKDGRKGAIRAKVIEENISITEMRTMTNVIFQMDYRSGAVQEGTVHQDSIILTLARATAWLGEKGCPLIKSKCEHFAVYCKIGNHSSFQKERLIKRFVTLLQESVKQIGIKLEINNDGTIMKIATSNFSRVSLLARQMQVIDLGLVAVIRGVAVLLDLKKIYRKRNDGFIKEEEFVGRFWLRICSRLNKVFYTGVRKGYAVTFGTLSPASAPATVTSILVGVICSGVLSIPWGSNGKIKLGQHILNRLVVDIEAREKAIVNIQDLSPGDHVIIYQSFLHPRCHVIVTSVDISSGSMCVIRFTHTHGAKEEKVNFQTPLYKVIYKRPDPPDIIIERARKSEVPSGTYNIVSFNCRHFAFCCQTNTLPNC